MTTFAGRVLVGLALAYFISDYMLWNFWLTFAGLVGIYLLVNHRHQFHIFGHGTVATHGGGHGIGGGSAVKAVILWIAVMMFGTAFIMVSNNSAFQAFRSLGWRFWLWPGSSVHIDLLMWVALAILVGWAASPPSARSNKKVGAIAAIVLIVTFTIQHGSRIGEMARPKPANGPATPLPGETQAWADTDQRASEIGAAPTAVCAGVQWTFGPIWPCVASTQKAVVPRGFRRLRGFLFGDPAPATPTAAPAPKVVVVSTPPAPGLSKQLYTFGADGCAMVPLRGNWSSYPKGGRICFIDPATGLVVAHDEPGKNLTSSLPDGTYRVCKDVPQAWGVEILQ